MSPTAVKSPAVPPLKTAADSQDFPSPGGEDRSQIRLGFQVRAGGIRWDAAALGGLTRRDPHAGLVFGLTKEFILWK